MTLFSDQTSLQNTAKMLKAIANEKRLKILCLLSCGEKTVGELEHALDLSQSALSQHLARLRRDDIVATRRDAQTIYYSISNKSVLEFLKLTCGFKSK